MAKEVGNSELLDTWAANGTIVEPSLAKKENGWDLGEQPPHEYANWVLNVLGQAVNHVLQNGVPAWNATTTYAVNNFVSRAGVIYVAKQESTNSQPPNANWQAVAPYSAHWSVEYLAGFLQLKGDVESPGNNKIYGTNGSGVRGWQDAPVQADGFKTGDIKFRYDTDALAGYCRMNGRTIGNASSGATERANADTEALFTHLWTKSPNTILPVSSGRGASAAADFAAGKTIQLPDWRARAAACVDGFGNANTDRVTNSGVGNPGVDATALGAAGGADRVALEPEQIAEHRHGLFQTAQNIVPGGAGRKDVGRSKVPPSGEYTIELGDNETDDFGDGEAHPNLQPTGFAGFYIKL